MRSFTPSLGELEASIDAVLDEYLSDRRTALPEAELLVDEIDRLVRAGGKRLRPSFCYWGYRSAGAEHSERIVRAAASLELLHTFAIVHDDIMDRSEERRAEPTVHVKHGNEVALLVGDLSLVLADHLFFNCGASAVTIQRAFVAYSRMRQEVIAGQFLDVHSSDRTDVDVKLARRIAVLKSGRYSVQEPLVIGALLAGAERRTIRGLVDLGEPLGEAFQLRDDLLGLFGERTAIGKSTDSDIREGKRHLLYAFTAEALVGEERDLFLRKWGAGATLGPEEIERLRELVVTSGARARCESHLETLERRAREILDALEVPAEAKEALTQLSARATHRST